MTSSDAGLENETCDGPIAFRCLRDDDLPVMHRWLNDPAIVKWWEGADVSWPAVVRRYGADHPTLFEHWIALLENEPIGWAQCYCAMDVAEGEALHWSAHLELPRTAGIDYLAITKLDVLRGRQYRDQVVHLEDEADVTGPPLGELGPRHVGNLITVDGHLPGGGHIETAEQVEQGGLPRA